MSCLFGQRLDIEVFTDLEMKSRFRARAKNGQIVFQSESYNRLSDCLEAARKLCKARLKLDLSSVEEASKTHRPKKD